MAVQLLYSSYTLHQPTSIKLVLEMIFIFLNIQWISDIGLLVCRPLNSQNYTCTNYVTFSTARILFIAKHYQAKYFVLFVFQFLHCPTCFAHSPCLVWQVGNRKFCDGAHTMYVHCYFAAEQGSRVQIQFETMFLYAASFCVGEVAYCEFFMTKCDINKERTSHSEFTRKKARKGGLTCASSR